MNDMTKTENKTTTHWILLVAIVLLFCIIAFFGNKALNIMNSQKEFKRKIICSEKKDDIKSELQIIRKSKRAIKDIKLRELFYSKKLNSCLYVTEYYDRSKHGKPYYIVLRDALTLEHIDSALLTRYFMDDGSKNNETWNKLENFRNTIDTYKQKKLIDEKKE